jgi:hypothetical protein
MTEESCDVDAATNQQQGIDEGSTDLHDGSEESRR